MDPTTSAFQELHRNLQYAHGRYLQALGVRAFDVTDLYRSAWVLAVAALDHWVHEEIYHRAVALALRPAGPKPARFHKLEMPMALFDRVHYEAAPLDELFGQHLRSRLGFISYQNPDRIREGFALVSDITLWRRVAEVMSGQARTAVTASEVRQRLEEIVWRRNRIAHEADRDPDNQPHRRRIGADETAAVIDHLEGVAAAVVLALAAE